MNHIEKFIVLSILTLALVSGLKSQTYEIGIWGIPCVAVIMDFNVPGQLSFQTSTIGLIDLIWPVDSHYTTTFDTVDFGIRSYTKKIKQGNFEQTLTLEYDLDSHELVYNSEMRIERPSETQTIFTILAQITKQPADYLDTRWLELEHEGSLYKTRLLWADSVSLDIDNSTYRCDHYRLDIVRDKSESSLNIIDRSDYFSEHIVHPDAIRQLWVERGERQRIIKASVKLFGFTLEAKLNE